jgi:hypothetical protein
MNLLKGRRSVSIAFAENAAGLGSLGTYLLVLPDGPQVPLRGSCGGLAIPTRLGTNRNRPD